jgi:hypothetical protein
MYSWRLDSIEEYGTIKVFAVCISLAILPIVVTLFLVKSKKSH